MGFGGHLEVVVGVRIGVTRKIVNGWRLIWIRAVIINLLLLLAIMTVTSKI